MFNSEDQERMASTLVPMVIEQTARGEDLLIFTQEC